jgi:hypothetical protein
MSLTQVVRQPNVRAVLAGFRPKIARAIPCPMLVPPRRGVATRIGMAFDYLLRFELGRRHRNVIERTWIADLAEDHDVATNEDGVFEATNPSISLALKAAKRDVATYRRKRKPSRRDQIKVADHSLILAGLDLVYRCGELPLDFDKPLPHESEELVTLLANVPWGIFSRSQPIWLNPTFEQAATLVGGADTDLIAGDMLIEVKTVSKQCVAAENIDQLLGYFLLARNERLHQPSFPEINRLGIYFSRHGYLWNWNVKAMRESPEFLALEKWFLNEANMI